MPQSKKPRKKYQGSRAERDLDNLARAEAKLHVEAPDTPTTVAQAAPSPAAHANVPTPKVRPRGRLMLAGAAAGGAAAGGAYLLHRKKNVMKVYNDPFTGGVIEVGKRSAKEHAQRNLYDSRVGVVSRQGRPARKVMAREANKSALRGMGVGAAAGGAAGALVGRKGGSAKAGAALGALFGTSYGGGIGAMKGRYRGYDKAMEQGLIRDRVKKAAPDRVFGFTTPAVGQTRSVKASISLIPGTRGEKRLERTVVRARRSNRDHLGKWTAQNKGGHGTKLVHVTKAEHAAEGKLMRFARRNPLVVAGAVGGGVGGAAAAAHNARKAKVNKAVSGPHGDNFPDRVMGVSTPALGKGRQIAALKHTGSHVAHGQDLEHFTGLKGYSGLPSGKTALGHYKKERDKAARAFVGKALVLPDLAPRFPVQGRHGRRIVE